MSSKNTLLILNIDKDGVSNQVELNPDVLDDDTVIFVIDEKNCKDWLYIGARVSFIHKRAAMRIANSLKKFGYKVNNSIVGHRCNELVVIDKTSNEPETRSSEDALRSVISSQIQLKNKPDVEVAENRSEAGILKDGSLIRPLDQGRTVKDAILQNNKAISLEEDIKNDFSVSRDNSGLNKFGVLVASMLQEFPELRIIRNHNKYSVESPTGEICRLELSSDKLLISAESNFGEGDVKAKIQQKFINLTKKLPEITRKNSRCLES